MKLKPFFSMLLISLLSSTTAHAAGGAVNENLKPLVTLTESMIAASKKNDADGFMGLVSQALKITAENYNNSMVFPRVSAKLRAAKGAVKTGKFNEAIAALQAAETEMQKKRVLAWDGGAE